MGRSFKQRLPEFRWWINKYTHQILNGWLADSLSFKVRAWMPDYVPHETNNFGQRLNVSVPSNPNSDKNVIILFPNKFFHIINISVVEAVLWFHIDNNTVRGPFSLPVWFGVWIKLGDHTFQTITHSGHHNTYRNRVTWSHHATTPLGQYSTYTVTMLRCFKWHISSKSVWCIAEFVGLIYTMAAELATVRAPTHDDVIKWKHLPRYWPFVRGIHRSPVNSPHKGQWRGALMFSLICVWINGWVNNGEAGDLRRYRAHYDVTVMVSSHNIELFPEYYIFSTTTFNGHPMRGRWWL